MDIQRNLYGSLEYSDHLLSAVRRRLECTSRGIERTRKIKEKKKKNRNIDREIGKWFPKSSQPPRSYPGDRTRTRRRRRRRRRRRSNKKKKKKKKKNKRREEEEEEEEEDSFGA